LQTEDIFITSKINDEQKKEVAKLYYKAFTKKFTYLWFFTKNERKAINVLIHSLQYEYAFYAVHEDKILGFIGLNKKKEIFFPSRYKAFLKSFRLLNATWRYLGHVIYRLTKDRLDNETMYIDPIVVSSEARGKGIGTKLMNATFELTKQLNLKCLSLDVVDTNPQAKSLYEKLGFQVVKEVNTKIITKKAGFKKYYHMEKTKF